MSVEIKTSLTYLFLASTDLKYRELRFVLVVLSVGKGVREAAVAVAD
jgi:hypothetical protein